MPNDGFVLYNVGKDLYRVADKDVKAFESENPDASIKYSTDDYDFDIPLSQREEFLKDVPNATFSQYDDKQWQKSKGKDWAPSKYAGLSYDELLKIRDDQRLDAEPFISEYEEKAKKSLHWRGSAVPADAKWLTENKARYDAAKADVTDLARSIKAAPEYKAVREGATDAIKAQKQIIDTAEEEVYQDAQRAFDAQRANMTTKDRIVKAFGSGSNEADPFGEYDPNTYRGWINTEGYEGFGSNIDNYEAAKNILSNAEKTLKSVTKTDVKAAGDKKLDVIMKGVGQGIGQYVSDLDSWSAILGAKHALPVYALQQKLDTIFRGMGEDITLEEMDKRISDGLTPSEQALFYAIETAGGISAALDKEIHGSVKAGESMAMSARMGLEFLLLSGMSGAANATVARNIEKRLARKLITKETPKAARKVISSLIKVGAEDTGALVGGGIQTALGPSNWAQVAKNIQNNYQQFIASNSFTSLMDPEVRAANGIDTPTLGGLTLEGLVQQLIENSTEFGFGPTNKAIRYLQRAGYKGFSKLGWNHIASLLTPQAAATLKKMGISPLREEFGEEVNEALISWVRGTERDDEGRNVALKNFFDAENLAILFATFVPTIGFGTVVSAAQRGAANVRFDEARTAYRNYLISNGVAEDKATNIVDSLNGATPEELGRRAARLLDNARTSSAPGKETEAGLILNLLEAARDKSALDGVASIKRNADRDNTFDEILGNTNKQFWQTREEDAEDEFGNQYKEDVQYVDVLTTNGENNFFIRSEDKNGNVETIDENGTIRRFTAAEVEQGLADGTFTGRRQMDMADYLDERNGVKEDAVWEVSAERTSQMAAYDAGNQTGQNHKAMQESAYDTAQNLESARLAAIEAGVPEDDLRLGSDVLARQAFDERQAGNTELATALDNYATAKAAYDGLKEGYIASRVQIGRNNAESYIKAFGRNDRIISGMYTDAKGEMHEGYILSEDIAIARDGSVTVIGGTGDSMVQVSDGKGGVVLVPASQLSAYSTTFDEYRNEFEAASRQWAENAFAEAESRPSRTAMSNDIAPLVGRTILVNGQDGAVGSMTIVSVNTDAGTVTFKDKSGGGAQNTISIDTLYGMAQRDAEGHIVLDPTATENKPIIEAAQQQAEASASEEAETPQATQLRVGDEVPVVFEGQPANAMVTGIDNDGSITFSILNEAGEDVRAGRVSGQEFANMMNAASTPVPAAPAQSPTPAPSPAPEPAPAATRLTPEQEYENVFSDDNFETEDEAYGFVKGKIKRAKDAADKAQAAVDKIKPEDFDTPQAYRTAKDKAKKDAEPAIADYEHWKAVKDLADAARQAEKERQERLARMEERALMEPHGMREVVANAFSANHSLNREDFKRETGLSDAELRRFFPFWAKKGKGMTVKAFAESIAANDDTGLLPRDGETGAVDTQAIRNEIIDLILSSQSPRDIMDYTRNENIRRQEEAERYAEGAPEEVADEGDVVPEEIPGEDDNAPTVEELEAYDNSGNEAPVEAPAQPVGGIPAPVAETSAQPVAEPAAQPTATIDEQPEAPQEPAVAPEPPVEPSAPVAAAPAIPASPAEISNAAEARLYFESQFGKGKRADNSVRVWELTHKNLAPKANKDGLISQMAMVLAADGFSEEEAAELMTLGTQLAEDYINDGFVRFPQFFKNFVVTFGDGIRPFVKSIYLGASANVSDEIADQMDDRKTVRTFDTTIDINDISDEQDDNNIQPEDGGQPAVVAGSSDGEEGGNSGEGDTGIAPIPGGTTDDSGTGLGSEGGLVGENGGSDNSGAGRGRTNGTPGRRGRNGGRANDGGRSGRGSATSAGGRQDGSESVDEGTGSGRESSIEEKEKAAAEAQAKARQAEKEAIKDITDTALLEGRKDELKAKLSSVTDKYDPERAKMAGQLDAILERLRELYANSANKTETLAQEKIPYQTLSDPEGEHAFGSVVPSGSADAMRDAVLRLEEEEGKNVAEFVKDELGYDSLDEMFSGDNKNEGLSSEQVDSVGLAIHQMKKGKMFIVGDMTGVGKGRQGAALIRWAKRQGKKVLFVTEKPDLFSDMYADLADIGTKDLVPFIVNSDAGANITDKNSEEKTILVKHPGKAEADNLYKSESDELPEIKKDKKNKGKRYDFVMMTYSQAQSSRTAAAQRKLDWIKRYAKDAIVICDESHNASGDSARGAYFRDIVAGAEGVTFMSATFAKRPDNMVLYALRSSMGDAQMTTEDMIKAIQQYGVPMQEILASSLFKTGEMVRRERDFSDVKTHWLEPKEVYSEEEIKQNRDTFDKSMGVVNEIIEFQRSAVGPVIKKLNENFEESNKAASAMLMAGGEGVFREYTITPYSSQVSNVANLMFYAIKAKKAADMAIEQIKQGKKPVIAVENTLESYLKDIEGDTKNADFTFVLGRGLVRSLNYRLKVTTKRFNKETGKVEDVKEKSSVTDMGSIEKEMGPTGLEMLDALRQTVQAYGEDADIAPLMLSPIDYIKRRIAAAGYQCGEITGRSLQLVQAPDGTYHTESFQADKKKAITQFNGGGLDALVLNTAGATGISLHASRRFKDQKPRSMIILQPARDPNTEVQVRGRVDRTGQVSRAEYFYVTSPIPAERKVIMMLRQKLASLDANSVGTENVSSNRVNADDMDNKYGDEVARLFLADHPEINEQLDRPIEQKKGEWERREGLLYDLLIGAQRMTCAEQEMILEELQNAYKDQIEYLNQNGINDLATTTMNLEAVTIDSGLFIKGKDNESMSEFAHDTNIERVEVNVLNKPLRSADINSRMNRLGALNEDGTINGDYGGEILKAAHVFANQAKAERREKHRAAEAELEQTLREKYPKSATMTDEEYEGSISMIPELSSLKSKNKADEERLEMDFNKQTRAVAQATTYFKPGMPMFIPLTDDLSSDAPLSFGRFIGFKIPKDGKPKGLKAVFATKDSRASVELPVVSKADVVENIVQTTYGRSVFGGSSLRDIGGPAYDSRITEEMRREARDKWWDAMIPKDTNRQIRYMVTGNILQACGSLGNYKGTITTFTRKDAETGKITVERGMLLAEDFDPENFMVRSAVKKEDVWEGYDQISDNLTNISVQREGDYMVVNFDRQGRENLSKHPIMKDDAFKALTIDGNVDAYSKYRLRAYIPEKNVEQALEHLYKNYGFTKGHLFVMPDSTERVDAIIYTDKPYNDVINEFEDKYEASEWSIDRKIKSAVQQYKMDVNNEDLKKRIREMVQLRQAYLRRRYAKGESSRLAWQVIIEDENIERAKDNKSNRDEAYARREAVKEELDSRGIHGNPMHFESGRNELDVIIKTFNELNKNKTNAEFAKKVFAIAKRLKLDVVMNEKIHNNTGGQTAGDLVEYNWKYMNSEWITDQMKADTILHELIHTATSYAKRLVEIGSEHLLLQDNPEAYDAVNALDALFAAIKRNPAFVHKQSDAYGDSYTDYGISDWFELLSEAGSNEEFRTDLKKVKVSPRLISGIVAYTDVTSNPEFTGRTMTAWDVVNEQLNNLLDHFGEHAYTEMWRGTGYGQRSYSTLAPKGLGERVRESQLAFRGGDKNKALASAVPGDESPFKATDVTSASGANILKDLELFAKESENISFRDKNSFLNDLAEKIGAESDGSGSRYATFEAKNGTVFTLRLSDHNATASKLDYHNEGNGISIVISRKPNKGITNDGKAHIVEFFYSDKQLRKADNNPYSKIVRSVIQSLYSGEYKDTTGLAIRDEVNNISSREGSPEAIRAKLDELELEATHKMLDSMESEFGIKINRVSRNEMPKGHETDKGYYDIATGEVTICMDNVANMDDAMATVLHESVGHLGLRRLLGSRFNDAMRDIYDHLDHKGKNWVNRYIASHDLKPGDPGIIEGVEEYLSHLAESGDFKNSVWDEIKQIICDVIDAIFGTDGFTLTDNELNYILRASYENLKDPNWLNTLEGQAKDMALKYQLGINETDPSRPTDPDGGIRFRESSGVARDDFEQDMRGWWNNTVTEHQNKYLPVQLAVKRVMEEVGKKELNEAEDFEAMAVLSSSRAQTEQQEFEMFFFSPILDQVRKIRDRIAGKRASKTERTTAYHEVLDYLYRVSGLERNEYKNNEIEQAKIEAVNNLRADAQARKDAIDNDANLSDAEKAARKDAIDAEVSTRVPEIEAEYESRKKDWSGLSSLEEEVDQKALDNLRPLPTDTPKEISRKQAQEADLRRQWWQNAEAKARAAVDDFRSRVGDDAMLTELWDNIRKATDYNLKHALDHGLLTQEEYDRLHGTDTTPRMWNYYLPLRGFAEETAEDVYDYSSFTSSPANGVVVKKMGGRWTEADNPLANILNIAETEIAQGNANMAKQALYRFALNAGENTLLSVRDAWYVKDPTTGKWTVAEVQINPATGKEETLEEFEARMEGLRKSKDQDGKPLARKGRRGLKLDHILRNSGHKGEHIIRLKVAGQEKVIWVNGNPAVAQAVNGVQRAKAWGWLRNASRALSNLFTTYSLDFSARNLIRDTMYSRMGLMVKENRAYRQQYRKNWWNNFGYGAFAFPMVRMMAQWESGRLQQKANPSRKEQMFMDFMRDGGATGYTIINSVDTIKRDLERAMRRSGEKGRKIRIPILGHYAAAVKTLNEGFELLTRFTAYQTSRQMGRSGQRSALDAKEISVNFNRQGAQSGKGGFMGALAAYMGATHYFYNAGVQGFDNFLRLFKAAPVKMTGSMAGLSLLGMMTPIINSAIAGLVSGLGGDDDDDKRDQWYWELPQWVRRNNIVLGWPGFYATIPLPPEFRAFYGLGDIAASFMYDKVTGNNGFAVAGDILNTAAGVLPVNPIENFNSNGNVGVPEGVLRTFFPDAGMFIVDLATNRDFTGKPLAKENPYYDTTPASQAVYASDPEYLVKATQWLAQQTAGTPVYMDLNAGKLRDIFKNFGGGFYNTAEDVAKIFMADEKHPLRRDNIPFFSGFTGHLDEDRANNFENSALQEYKDISERVVRRISSAIGDKVSPADVYNNPENLPQEGRVQALLEGKDYQLGKMYHDGMNNRKEIIPGGAVYKSGKKKGQPKPETIPGVNKLRQNWKDMQDAYFAMPEGDEKEAFKLQVQDAFNKYHDAEGNLCDKLLEYENENAFLRLHWDKAQRRVYEDMKSLVR